jgi:iron complex outermembrane receptor protein
MSDVVINGGIIATENMPVNVLNLNRVDVEKTSYGQEFPYFISKTPSITYTSDAGSQNGYVYMRLRGLDQTRINATLNGVPLNEPEDEGAYFNNYVDFLNSVESVQIQKGVGTSTFGVTSYVGSINFTSLKNSELNSNIQFGAGSYNTKKGSIEYNTNLMNNWNMYLRYSQFQTDGYRDHSGNKSKSFFVSTNYITGKNILNYTSFYGKQRNQMAYLAASVNDIAINPKTNYLSSDERDDFDYYFNQVQYLTKYNNLDISTSLYYIHLKGNYDVAMPDMYNFNLKSNLYGGFVNLIYNKENYNLYFGFNFNVYNREHWLYIKPYSNSLLYDNSGDKNDISGFVKYNYNITEKLSIYSDLQLRVAKFNYNKDLHSGIENIESKTWSFVNPKIGLNYKASDLLSIYAFVGNTHREPTRNDMFNGYDNLDTSNIAEVVDFNRINSESVVDYESGLHYKTDYFNADFDVFYMGFKNEIAPIGKLSYIGLPLRKNVPSSKRYGMEVMLNKSFNKYFSISQNVTIMKSKILSYTTEYDNITYNNVTPLLSPMFIADTELRFTFKKFEVALNGHFISENYLDNENTAKIPAYLILNSTVNYRIFDRLNLMLQLNNLTNKVYYSSGYVSGGSSYMFVQAPFNIFAMVQYDLH